MKVEQSEENIFKPFKIVIESNTEAMMLWHILNCCQNQSLADYCEDRNGLRIHYVDQFKTEMWTAIDKHTVIEWYI